jgi:DNA polymerase (family X)
MTNPEIANLFTELADIMEIAGENYFKIKAYRNAAVAISTHDKNIQEMRSEDIARIPGVGKAILEKIEAVKASGSFPTLEKWRNSDFGTLRCILGLPNISLRILKALMKDLNIASKNELAITIADGRFQKYDKLTSETKNLIMEFTNQNG